MHICGVKMPKPLEKEQHGACRGPEHQDKDGEKKVHRREGKKNKKETKKLAGTEKKSVSKNEHFIPV